MKKQIIGKLGENIASKYLSDLGYQYRGRNFRSYFGEIDLIFQSKKQLIFVEVKTRIGDLYGLPEEALTKYKLKSICKTADFYKLRYPKASDSLRIDLIAITLNNDYGLKFLKHYKNITL